LKGVSKDLTRLHGFWPFKTSSLAGTGMRGLLLAGMLFPLYWMVVSSLTPESQLFEAAPIVPRTASLEHYRTLFDERGFLVPIRNSLIVAGLTTLLVLPLATCCAYAVARLRMPRKRLLLSLILAVSMFPQISIVPPLYLMLREVGLLDTYPGLVLPYLTFATPLAVWLLTAFFRQLPRDLEDAASLDGAGRLRTLRDILLPLAAPGLASTAILTFLYCWNEFLFALSFTLGPERQTVPVAIALFRGRYQVPWGEVLAASVTATVPVALLVLAFQRRIVAGLTSGAAKG
jgi:ABC-type glycerol-3-phosphate transport system permease component